jgi:hypothetical protein
MLWSAAGESWRSRPKEADEKTSKLLQAKNLAAMLSDRRKGP